MVIDIFAIFLVIWYKVTKYYPKVSYPKVIFRVF